MQKRNNREIRYLKKEEWGRLVETIDDFRDKVIIKLLYATGMRVGELAKMRVEDIDFQERWVHIPAKNTKTRTARTVIVDRETLSDLKAYFKIEGIKCGSVFDLTIRRIQQILDHYSERAGIKATPHTLRHTHIVHALLDKVPITAVQKQVGHKRLTTTQVYSDLAPEEVREACEGRRGL